MTLSWKVRLAALLKYSVAADDPGEFMISLCSRLTDLFNDYPQAMTATTFATVAPPAALLVADEDLRASVDEVERRRHGGDRPVAGWLTTIVDLPMDVVFYVGMTVGADFIVVARREDDKEAKDPAFRYRFAVWHRSTGVIGYAGTVNGADVRFTDDCATARALLLPPGMLDHNLSNPAALPRASVQA